MAYCLLGIMGVNMPMLYGEGSQAFRRLQLEILNHSLDDSILAWSEKNADRFTFCSLLAPSPLSFRDCGQVSAHDSPAISYANGSVQMEVRTWEVVPGQNLFEVHLSAKDFAANRSTGTFKSLGIISIRLQRLSSTTNEYVRVMDTSGVPDMNHPIKRKISVRLDPKVPPDYSFSDFHSVIVRERIRIGISPTVLNVVDVWPRNLWDFQKRQLVLSYPPGSAQGTIGLLLLKVMGELQDNKVLIILSLGPQDNRPRCSIFSGSYTSCLDALTLIEKNSSSWRGGTGEKMCFAGDKSDIVVLLRIIATLFDGRLTARAHINAVMNWEMPSTA